MVVTNRPNSSKHEDAISVCSPCDQLPKPDKIIKFAYLTSHRNYNYKYQSDLVKASVTIAEECRNNVISIAEVKANKLVKKQQMRRANFKYPMLECS